MSSRESNALPRACLAASAVTLGHALQIANGFYDERALSWLTAALVLALGGIFIPSISLRWRQSAASRFRGRDHEHWLHLATSAAIAWQILSLFQASPGISLTERADLNLFKAGVIAEAALIGIGTVRIRMLVRAWFPVLLVVQFALGTWLLRAAPSPPIDVVTVHRQALHALGERRSPYQITFKNIYGAGSGNYNPSLVEGDRVMFGYPYPPLSLLLAAPGQFIAGDYRYAQLIGWIGAAGLIGYARASLFAKLAAALLLTTPRGFFVLEQGWTEPIALLMLALTVFSMTRKPSLSAWAVGLLIVTKQYLALAVPLLWRFAKSRSNTRSVLARAALVGALVTVPFVLWHPRSFIESVVLLQTREPFRIDSLSYLSWAARHGLGAGSYAWAIAAATVGLAATMWATPNTASGFATSLALATFATFAFGSKAFCNYYFFVVGALCCAASAASSSQPEHPAVALTQPEHPPESPPA